MAVPVRDKYFLKTLHEEIDLFDRKLAHLLKYEAFATDAARKTSASKMQAKRDLLAQTARSLVSEGVEFKQSDLPRSFRPAGESGDAGASNATAKQDAEPVAANVVPASAASRVREFPSPFAGTVLDGRPHVEAYKRTRAKVSTAAASPRT